MSMLAIPHGLHPSIASADYHVRELGMASCTALEQVGRSPSHYKFWLGGREEEPTPALLFGAAFHCALLEPHVFEATYAAEPDFGDCRFKENKARRDTWRAGNIGKTLITESDMAHIKGMIAKVQAHPLAAAAINDGVSELTARWRDPETGLECKGRADYYVARRRMVVDLKSTEDARSESFRKTVANNDYHRQSAFYQDGFRAIGQPVDHFVFVAVEKKPPYEPAVFTLDAAAVSKGRELIRVDMLTLSECVRTGQFPGYPVTIQTLSLPPWAA